MAVRLQGDFYSEKGAKYTVGIYDSSFSGTATDFDATNVNIQYDFDGKDNDRFCPIISSTATVTMMIDTSTLTTFIKDWFNPSTNKWIAAGRMVHIMRKKDGVPYLDWAKDKHLYLTEGNVTDFNAVQLDIQEAMQNYSVQKVYYDPWQSTQFASELFADGVPMEQFRQTVVNYNEPIREMEALISKGQIWHGGDPVLRWMAGNITLKTNHTGLVMFDKDKSQEKIDGMVVLAMCYAAYMDSKKGQMPFDAESVISFI